MFDALLGSADDLAPAGGRAVWINFVATLDGHITRSGGSTALGGPGDKAMFFALRGVCDGVLAGTGTLAAEHYGRLAATPERRAARAARGLDPDPVMLVCTRSGNVPWDAPLFDVPEQRVLIAGPAEPPAVRARVEVIRDAAHPRDALDAFAERGVEHVLCEGGPALSRSLFADDLVDELFLTLDPSVQAGAGLRLLEGDTLPEPRALTLRWVLRHDNELFLRYAR